MKKHIQSLLVITLIFGLFLLKPLHCKADAIKIHNENDFYTALSKQISECKKHELYYISPDDLHQKITVQKNIEDDFMHHYNPKDPLLSGCYNYLCVKSYSMSWYESHSHTLNVTFEYNVIKSRKKEYMDEIEDLAKSLKRDSDFETVKAVHDYIIRRVEYDYSKKKTNYTDVEGFRDNVMVCQGYAMASYAIFAKMGIPCRIIIGHAGGDSEQNLHAWNIVQVDGKWYNYDATWDDAKGENVSYTYFLKGKNDFPNHIADDSYSPAELNDLISDDSYHLPVSMAIHSTRFIRNILIDAGLIIINIAVIIICIKARKKQKPVGTVINDDFDKIIY
ncbi:MAG: hypothetical protein K6G76_06570 [Lachnospiraceae bacterium]|nr:hypothetical protein [Lachnospiraceae bacterium]